MMIGMLWHGLDLSDAVQYYEKKYGKKAGFVHCNPDHLEEINKASEGLNVQVKADRAIMRKSLWIGVEE